MMSIGLFYGYSFYFAGYLRWNEFVNGEGKLFTGGTAIVIIFCVLMSSFGIAGSAPHMAAIQEGKIAGAFAFEVIDHVPAIKPNEPGTTVLKHEDVKGEIKFENVNFSYPSSPDSKVLKGLTCTFKAGETVGLVGPSGGGKSTIIQMLERFYDPTEGTIFLDGKDIKTLNLTSMRRLIGYVP